MGEKGFDWRKIIFALAISLLFIPMVYLGINTFFPEGPDFDDCYAEVRLPCEPGDEACYEQNTAQNKENRECMQAYEKERTKYDSGKYIALMIICVIASFVMLIKLDKSIIYGLFFGVVITAFSGTMQYMGARSLIGFILMVCLFILIIYFVQRERKNS